MNARRRFPSRKHSRSWRLLSRSLRECQKEVSVQKAFKVLETLRECQKEVSVQKAFKVLETLRECQKEVSVQKAFKVLETLESKSP